MSERKPRPGMGKWFLTDDQADVWASALNAQLEAVGKTRAEVIAEMRRPASFKGEASRFIGGKDEEVLRRWLDTHKEKSGEPFAQSIGWTLDALVALLAQVRGGTLVASDERRRWHPAFPALFEDDVAIPAYMDPVRDDRGPRSEGARAPRRARVCGPRDLGLRLAVRELQQRKVETGGPLYVEVTGEEIHESETPRPAAEGEDVFVLRPWGVAQVLELVRKLVGGARVSGEQATRVQGIAARLEKEPALLGGLTRPGEIISWLGRIATGRKVDDASNAREAALAAEEREWFESPAGPMLSALGAPAIEAILMTGWEADARSRQDWERAIGMCRREPAGLWMGPAAKTSLAGGKKSLSPEILETLLGLRSPAQVLEALILGRVLWPVDESARLVPARATTFAMRLGRAIAQRRGRAKFWCRNADRPHALEILRQAAQAGLPWSDLRTALRDLREAEPRLEVDACRAAIAFAAYTSNPDTVTVDEEFVRWWAGAVKAAMLGVHHPDSLWELRFATLGRAHGEPCPLLPWELDLAGLPESVELALPFIFPEDFPSALDAKCSPGVRDAVNRWLAAMSDVVGWSRFGEDAEYLAFTRLAPKSVVPLHEDAWALERWSHIEQRAERDARIRAWLCKAPDDPHWPPPSTAEVDLRPPAAPARSGPSTPPPPSIVSVRWIPRGDDLGENALQQWLRLVDDAREDDSRAPDEAEIEHLAQGLAAFEPEAVTRLLTDAITGRGRILSNTGRKLGLLLAEKLGRSRLVAAVSVAIRRYFSGRFLPPQVAAVQEGRLERFHVDLEADMRFGLEAAAVAFRLGVPEELRAWADAGPDLELPGPARAWYHRWIVLQKARWPGHPPGANEAPPPEMCARQLDEWFPSDARESVFLPQDLTFAVTEARRLQDFAPVRVLLAFGRRHDDSRRQIRDDRPADDNRKLSRAEEAVAEIAKIGHREASEPLDVVLFRVALTARQFPARIRGEVFAWADGVSIDDEARALKRIAEASRGAALERLFLEGDTGLDNEVIAAICGRETTAHAQRLRGRLRDDRFKACVPRLLARSRDDGERQELRRMLGLPEPERKGAPTARVAVDLSEHEGALREERLLIACREPLATTARGRAFLARLADEARASGNLVEALYFELCAGRPVVDLVRRILEQPELEALDDDFQLVWRSRKPIGVAGGFVTLIRLALTDATDEQLRRLARELSTTGSRTRRFDSHWVRAADREERLPDPGPQLGGGGVFCRRDAVCALVGRLTVDERLALGRARLFELDQIDFWKRHAPLSGLWSLLEEVRRSPDPDDTGRSRLYEEGEPCLNALAERDPERFQATAQAWLAEPDIDSRLARELMRRLLRDRPELCVSLFEALLVHPSSENRDWARRWAADAAPSLPRGGAFMRRITYGD